MTFLEVLLLALALSADAFSVAASVGAGACLPRQRFRLSFHFGLFQSLMPILGALLGHFVLVYVQSYAPWVAFGLLEIIGLKMLIEAIRRKPGAEECRPGDPTRGLSLIGLSLAVSVDAFGAGVGMSMVMGLPWLLLAVLIIGLSCGLITWAGMRAGSLLKRFGGRTVELLAGLVLIVLGVRMLFT